MTIEMTDTKIDWREIKISPCQRYHIYHDQALYGKRFIKVLKYHSPGLAPVMDQDGAYHIDIDGEAIYSQRFLQTFGFYQGRAAAEDRQGWYHIDANGQAIYSERYQWCGNFQNDYCTVVDKRQRFFHIDREGNRIYAQTFEYAGDFRDGIAVVQQNNRYSHINSSGEFIHDKWFSDLDVYHKGFARACDDQGWFHIDVYGQPLYPQRYRMIEAFYNGLARVQTQSGAMQRIDEQGQINITIKSSNQSTLHQLSAKVVGYWQTQTIFAAVELAVFKYLPANVVELKQTIGLTAENCLRLLRALQELSLVHKHGEKYYPTELAHHLLPNHPQSLCEAVKHWATSHYSAWGRLVDSLQQDKPMYEQIYGAPLFEWLEQEPGRLEQYQKAMRVYADHDYQALIPRFDLRHARTIIDAGGGYGSLLTFALEANPHLTGYLLERSRVLETVAIPKNLQGRMHVSSFDLFTPWPKTADVIVMSRVLHDWNDVECVTILTHAKQALNRHGKLIIVECLLDEDIGAGGMLDLNMLVITGGKERSLEQYEQLVNQIGLTYNHKISAGFYHALVFCQPSVGAE